MDLELESVRRWFSRLRTMQTCAANISHDTPESIAAFYNGKHAEIISEPAQRDNFAFCVFRNTNISITNQDFQNTSTFSELLNESHRSLRTAMRSLFRAVAITLQTVGPDEDPLGFESRAAKDVFVTSQHVSKLCTALASVMPIFPQDTAGEAPFRTLLAKPQTKISDAIKQVLEG
jgi:hypothetical protein